MRYITRNLRFEDGEWDKPDEAGTANWRVVAVLRTDIARSAPPRVEYLLCLIEDRT